MSERGDGPNLRWWQLPGAWLSEQKLWRDVLTRVLAGVITAAIVYAGAVLLGYLHTPELEAGALLALGIAGGVLLVGIAVLLVASLPARRRAGRAVLGRTIAAGLLVVASIALVLGVIADVQGAGAAP
ncbi:hypothetical protein SCB71_19155 [Herbiconiux sp. KACC 21604]|uniref:hypothetical protein n=1 Tax=unclassified Herbiconiux TaxID=2618217 RepID=UPI001491B167|nr:hypothetical protein [Herbiconiux sp. SALV-R1]QJU55161.1 hypothetical protein HL652_17090 [Herbiconiux sp. SALV-R1]WPO86316.1 hypothetical protein SCB71_19155 [Herbiconiux sp. KACC 21604]